MSFLSGLGKVLGIGGSAVAAPFTGGASLAGLPAILGTVGKVAGAAAPVLGGIAAGRSQGKQTEANLNQQQDQARQQLYQTLVNAQLGRYNAQNNAALGLGSLNAQKAKFELDAPQQRFNQAMHGNYAANVQDVQANVPDKLKNYLVTYSGGLRPSAFGEGGRAAGRQLADLATAAMGKDTFQIPEMATLPDMPAAPGLTPLPKAGAIDRILGIAGPAAGFAGALGGLLGSSGPTGPSKYTTPGAPVLSQTDMAYLQGQSPELEDPTKQQAFFNPGLLRF